MTPIGSYIAVTVIRQGPPLKRWVRLCASRTLPDLYPPFVPQKQSPVLYNVNGTSQSKLELKVQTEFHHSTSILLVIFLSFQRLRFRTDKIPPLFSFRRSSPSAPTCTWGIKFYGYLLIVIENGHSYYLFKFQQIMQLYIPLWLFFARSR